MKIQLKYAASAAIMPVLALKSEAFSTPHAATTFMGSKSLHSKLTFSPHAKHSVLFAFSVQTDSEIERLKSMAARLRAEATELEAKQQEAVAMAAEIAFRKFDTNQDGEISLQELKAGLEKELKIERSEKRVKQLLADFDKNKDGALQLDEFVSVDVLRNRLDALARDEKALSLEQAKSAQMEAEALKLLTAQLEMINNKPPTNTDKLLSALPYLFPLLDGLQFAKFLVMGNLDSPVPAAMALIYTIYRSIPFSGLLCFFALNSLSGNPSINRLIRFNMQQAIFIDIAIFFPGLIGALVQLIAPGTIPASFNEFGNDAVFISLLVVVGYCVISSLLGQEPNKVPLISDSVQNRMPAADMFDAQGRFVHRNQREEKDEEKKD